MYKFDKDEVCTACIHRVCDLFLTDGRSDVRDAFEQGFKEGAQWLYSEKMQAWHMRGNYEGITPNLTGELCLIEDLVGRFHIAHIYFADYNDSTYSFYTYQNNRFPYNDIYRWAYVKDLLPPVNERER